MGNGAWDISKNVSAAGLSKPAAAPILVSRSKCKKIWNKIRPCSPFPSECQHQSGLAWGVINDYHSLFTKIHTHKKSKMKRGSARL